MDDVNLKLDKIENILGILMRLALIIRDYDKFPKPLKWVMEDGTIEEVDKEWLQAEYDRLKGELN